MKYSIITVVYNSESLIEETIKSVLSQDYIDKEYIIIDGNSTDRTIPIVMKYGDRINTILSEPDNGIYDAMNKGIKCANGDWICFMNSGDSFYDNHVLSKVAPFLDDNYAIVYGNTQGKHSFGYTLRQAKEPAFIKKGMPCCHQSCFAKADFMKRNLFDLSYKYVADYDFIYKSYMSGNKVKKIDVVVSVFDQIEGLTASNGYGVLKEVLKVQSRSAFSVLSFKLHLKYYRYAVLERLKHYCPNFIDAVRRIKNDIML